MSAFRLNGPANGPARPPAPSNQDGPAIGLDPALFGKQPGGAGDRRGEHLRAGPQRARDPASRRPGRGLRVCDRRHARAGDGADEGACSCSCSPSPPQSSQGDSPELPIVVRDGSAARRRFESAFDTIRQVFPPALCYTKIVPVDEVVTLDPFLSRRRPPAAADARPGPGRRARPPLDRASLREPGCAHARRCVSAAPGICDAGCRPQGLRADAQADQRPRGRVSPRARGGRAAPSRRSDRAGGAGLSPAALRYRGGRASRALSHAARANRSRTTRRSACCSRGCWSRRRSCTGSKNPPRARKPPRSTTGSWQAG